LNQKPDLTELEGRHNGFQGGGVIDIGDCEVESCREWRDVEIIRRYWGLMCIDIQKGIR
jgi:hypothetical protein